MERMRRETGGLLPVVRLDGELVEDAPRRCIQKCILKHSGPQYM
mgnify:CR=1 FL=1